LAARSRESPIRFSNSHSTDRHCERSEAIHSQDEGDNRLLRRFAPRNDVDMRRPSRGAARPSCARNLSLETRGRRECRVPVAPAASRAKIKKHTSVVTTGSPVSPSIPCAMVLTVSFVLSPVTGLSCHRRLADTSAKLERQRRGVRTTRLRRPQAPVYAKGFAGLVQVRRSFSEGGSAPSSEAPPASTASRLTSVTIAIRPSVGAGRREF
jgi:hypothetical protein